MSKKTKTSSKRNAAARSSLARGSTLKKRQHTSYMWASGWVWKNESYPSVFVEGAHKLWPVYPDEEVKKAPRRDVQWVKVTIEPARRRIPSRFHFKTK